MANLSISKIGQRIFNTTKHEQTVARTSNPFAKMTFKGNVLTADVFESSAVKNADKVTAKDKLKASALVGSISDLGSKIRAGIEAINDFGSRMKENIVNTWDKINSITLSDIGNSITEKVGSLFENKNTLAKHPVSELREMLIHEEAIAHAA